MLESLRIGKKRHSLAAGDDFEPLQQALGKLVPTRSPTSSPNEISVKDALQTLARTHHFVQFYADGSHAVCRASFTENFQQLALKTHKVKRISTVDIVSIESGFSTDMSATLAAKNYSAKSYGFVLVTQQKQFEFSASSRLERDSVVASLRKLLQLQAELKSSKGLSKYWHTLQQCQESQVQIKQLSELVVQQQTKLSKQRKAETRVRTQIVCDTMTNLIVQVELDILRQRACELQNRQTELDRKQEEFQEVCSHQQVTVKCRDEEIQNLVESVQTLEEHSASLYKSLKYKGTQEMPWLQILNFLSFRDLLVCRGVSTALRKLVQQLLGAKSSWKLLPTTTLQPRTMSWKMFMGQFYHSYIKDIRIQVPPKIHTEIHKDVSRGLPDSYAEVESILIRFCALNSDVGYCQGMQQVAYFLLKKFRNVDQVLRVFLSIMRPPFYLGDMWKTGFPRLKIAIFQLEFLTKLRLPMLAKHMKALGLKLDIIVSSWLLTVFVYLNSQQGFPIEVIEHIWDYFLVHGWPGLIGACLALLEISQEFVIGQSLEGTIEVYSGEMPYKNLGKVMNKWEIDPGLLDELEKAYYMQTC